MDTIGGEANADFVYIDVPTDVDMIDGFSVIVEDQGGVVEGQEAVPSAGTIEQGEL